MQLVRLLRPAPRTLSAKLTEIFLALGLELRLEKAEILRRHLNLAPFGGPLVGLCAASRELFGKTPERLTPAEAALLAALPQNPSRLLKPSQRPVLKMRRDRIIRAMRKLGFLEASARDRALAAPLARPPLRPRPRLPISPAMPQPYPERPGEPRSPPPWIRVCKRPF